MNTTAGLSKTRPPRLLTSTPARHLRLDLAGPMATLKGSRPSPLQFFTFAANRWPGFTPPNWPANRLALTPGSTTTIPRGGNHRARMLPRTQTLAGFNWLLRGQSQTLLRMVTTTIGLWLPLDKHLRSGQVPPHRSAITHYVYRTATMGA